MIHFNLECKDCDDKTSTRDQDRSPAEVVMAYLENHHRHTGVWVVPDDRVEAAIPKIPFGALDG